MGVVVPGSPALPHPDAESKEVELVLESIDRFGLCLIQCKSKPFQYMPQHRHGLVRSRSSTEYDDVVRIADDACAYPLLEVSSLPDSTHNMQVEVCQQRGDDTALWGTFAVALAADVSLRSVLVPLHDRGLEPHLDAGLLHRRSAQR